MKFWISKLCHHSVGLDGVPQVLAHTHMWIQWYIHHICYHYCLPYISKKHPQHQLYNLPTLSCLSFGGVDTICFLDYCVQYNPSIIKLNFSQHILNASRRAHAKDSASLYPDNYLYIAAGIFLFCTLRYFFDLVKRPYTDSCGFELFGFFNLDRGSLESHNSLVTANNGWTEVLNKSMTADCSAVRCTLASQISLLWDISTLTISSVTNWKYERMSRNHWDCSSGTCFWDNIMQSSKILKHHPFMHTNFESIFAVKLVNYHFTQSSITFSSETTGVLDKGMMGFIFPKIITWFSFSCCILTGIPYSYWASWAWRYFLKLSRSAS